ncbi:hypothetical protein A2U01_0081471 [Trifolium medium]|uniref:Uncharacterized protein n=1 Tax=Trifolium medium TaxID=97028 RepID=A0A392TJB7_9FABA|nr:hypothetical protein [Trifolium medium]
MFWDLRVAQGYMARCAVQSETAGLLSGICALRSMRWRGAQLNQIPIS